MSDAPQGEGWWQASDGKWYPPQQASGATPAGSGGGAPGGTDIGAIFGWSWNKFIQNIGQWIVLWLILVGISILYWIVGVAVIVGSSSGGVGSFGFSPVGLVLGVVYGAVLGVLLVVIAKGAVQVANGQPVDIGAAFKLTGNNIVAGVIFGLIFGLLAYSFCWIFGLLAFLFLGFMPALSALDDKGAESLSESVNLSTNNANTGMVWLVISWLLAGVICSIGAPIAMLGSVYLIRRYRGEAVAA